MTVPPRQQLRGLGVSEPVRHRDTPRTPDRERTQRSARSASEFRPREGPAFRRVKSLRRLPPARPPPAPARRSVWGFGRRRGHPAPPDLKGVEKLMTTLMQAHRQWMSRAPDERFVSLIDMQSFKRNASHRLELTLLCQNLAIRSPWYVRVSTSPDIHRLLELPKHLVEKYLSCGSARMLFSLRK